MKNWIKILTLAGFIFLGTMIHSAVSANYTQGLSDGWFNTPCLGGGNYFGSTPGCDSGVKFFSSPYSGDFASGAFQINGSPYVDSVTGAFTEITSITMTVNNSSGSTLYGLYGIYQDSLGAYEVSDSHSIPPGVSDVTFNITPTGHAALTLTWFQFAPQPYFTGDARNIQFAGTDTTINVGIIGLFSNFQTSSAYTHKFAINGGFTPPITPVTITNPPPWVNQYGLDYEIPVDGTCPENGTTTMVVSWPGSVYMTEPVTCQITFFLFLYLQEIWELSLPYLHRSVICPLTIRYAPQAIPIRLLPIFIIGILK